jgi:hypothetical protein
MRFEMNPEHEKRIRLGLVVALGCVVAAIAIPAWFTWAPASRRQTGITRLVGISDDSTSKARPYCSSLSPSTCLSGTYRKRSSGKEIPCLRIIGRE